MKTYINLLEVINHDKRTYFKEKKEGKHTMGFVRIKSQEYYNIKDNATRLECLILKTDKKGCSRYYSSAVYDYQEYLLFGNKQALKIN